MTVDQKFMKIAIELAKNGMGTTSPNPMVGAIVVKDNIILGKGWHQKAGEPHAEPNAINDCVENIEGATVYVTLEPCCHTNKRTPPCTNLLISKKVVRVVIAVLDPNPSVAGKGVKQLQDAGIEVEVGVLEEEATKLNEVFFKNITQSKPFIHLKMAQTLDGKISTVSGDSKWISDECARKEVHELRFKYDAVMVGRNTLNNDNPSLNIRMGVESHGKVPKRIVIGNVEGMNLNSTIFNDEHTEKTIIITSIEDYNCASDETISFLNEKKVVFCFASIREENMSLNDALIKLYELGICSILVEGGAGLAKSLIDNNLIDKITLYVAPKILGEGVSYIDRKVDLMSESIGFKEVKTRVLGEQSVFELYPQA